MIKFDFDQHICTTCGDAGQPRRVDQVPLNCQPPAFMLVCANCGDEDGPYAGPADPRHAPAG